MPPSSSTSSSSGTPPSQQAGACDVQVQVHVRAGRVHSTAVAMLPGSPQQLWSLLACKESQPLFRVERRQQLSLEGALETERVTFLAAVRVLFWKRWARTTVEQLVDFTNPLDAAVSFQLLQSDMMSSLEGSWRLEQLEPATRGRPAMTRVTYKFSMWPKGVPVALRFMPGLMEAVRGAVCRESTQLFDKLAFVAGRLTPDGANLRAAAAGASAEVERAGGSFKCLQALMSGSAAAAAAAAAAEAAARLQLQADLQQEQQQLAVLAHALEFSDDEDDAAEQPAMQLLLPGGAAAAAAAAAGEHEEDDGGSGCLTSSSSDDSEPAPGPVAGSSRGSLRGSGSSSEEDGDAHVDICEAVAAASLLDKGAAAGQPGATPQAAACSTTELAAVALQHADAVQERAAGPDSGAGKAPKLQQPDKRAAMVAQL